MKKQISLYNSSWAKKTHEFFLYKKSNLDSNSFEFCNRIVNTWNILPKNIVLSVNIKISHLRIKHFSGFLKMGLNFGAILHCYFILIFSQFTFFCVFGIRNNVLHLPNKLFLSFCTKKEYSFGKFQIFFFGIVFDVFSNKFKMLKMF